MMEELVQLSDSSLTCSLQLTDFPYRLSQSKVGEKLESSPLVISWSTFTVGVFLRGESSEADHHVSVFLFNESDWLVKAEYKISVAGFVFGQSAACRTFYPRGHQKYPGWGFLQCIPHERCCQADLLDQAGTLTIKIELEIVDELLPAGLADRSRDSRELKAKVQQITERVEGSLPVIETELQDIKNMLRKVVTSMTEGECPLCLRRLQVSALQQQCTAGHRLCGDCEDQAGNLEDLEVIILHDHGNYKPLI